MDKKRLPVSVLCVEDELDVLHEIRDFLIDHVNLVLTASDGSSAMEIFKAEKPDIVITDIRMPVLSGLDLVTGIKTLDPDARIIVISAYSETDYFLHMIDKRISRFLLKPFSLKDLLDQVDILCQEILLNRRLKKQEHLLKNVLDNQESMIILTDGKEIVDANRSFYEFFGCERAEDVSISDYFLSEQGYVQSFEGLGWLEYFLSGVNEASKIKMTNPVTGQVHVFMVRVSRFLYEKDYYVISMVDVTALDSEVRTFAHLAHTDPLTRISNRLKFDNMLSQEIRRSSRYHMPLSLIMLDIDDFKKVNDTYGHQAGDRVLKETVRLVKDTIRNTDFFTRWGGEEFVVLATDTSLSGACLLAERIREVLDRNPFHGIGHVTCSLGVAVFEKGDTPETLLGRADMALYEAKKNGKNRVVTA